MATAYLRGNLWTPALLHCKYAAIRAVARDTVNMRSIGLAAISVAPSVDLEASKHFSKKLLKLETFC